jgi:GntR family negative regulator for fad regulon and positive regulator of fabA
MGNWKKPTRPAAYSEQALITAILDGTFPPGSTLPGERELAASLGVARPALRETLQRLACEGWLVIQQGKPTRINDFWLEGGLSVLGALVRYSERLPASFVPNLLEVRLALAPAYTKAAVVRSKRVVLDFLSDADKLEDTPEAFAAFDWRLHRGLAIASGNPIYTLILNGFSGFYEQMACQYFADSAARTASRAFYAELKLAAREGDAGMAERVTRDVMLQSMELWRGSTT